MSIPFVFPVRRIGSWAAFTLALLVNPTPSSAATAAEIQAVAVVTPPRIDGRLDDPVWRQAAVIEGFVQQRPQTGEPSTARTEVRVLYTRSALYIGFRGEEWHPLGVLARSLGRDPDLGDEDSFAIFLDTFGDRQNGFEFRVNPRGARFDQLVRGEGEFLNPDWDGVWSARTRIDDRGWEAEIEIPWRTLRFPRAPRLDMGINFERQRRAVNEQSHWRAIPRQFDLHRASLAGTLRGLEGIDPGRNVVARPYVLARTVRGEVDDAAAYDADDWDGEADVGLDVKVGIRSSLTLDLTLNPDFAQVEADDQLVNLTRFPLFFPEKREFFLEKANLFRFGSPSNLLFYSRGIGLDERGRTIPIQYGTRLTGKLGRTELGLMDIEQEGVRGLPTRRFDVLRMRRDVGTRSSLGIMALQRRSDDDGDVDEPTHRALGFDGDLNPTDELLVSGYVAWTDEDGLGDDNRTWGTRWRYSHPLWVLTYIHESIGRDYAPRVGFVERTGIEVNALGWEYTPEPDWKWIRRFENQGFFYWFDNREGPFESRYIHINPVAVGPSEQRVSVFFERDFDRLLEPFELGSKGKDPDVVVPIGAYTYDYWGALLETDPSHWWTMSFEGRWGEFFDGTLSEGTLSLGIERAPHWKLRLEFERARARREAVGGKQAFDSDLVRLRVGYDASNQFGIDLFAQYNAAEDLMLSQLRAHWIFGDESDLYLVFTDARDDGSRDWKPRRQEGTVKLSYARRL